MLAFRQTGMIIAQRLTDPITVLKFTCPIRKSGRLSRLDAQGLSGITAPNTSAAIQLSVRQRAGGERIYIAQQPLPGTAAAGFRRSDPRSEPGIESTRYRSGKSNGIGKYSGKCQCHLRCYQRIHGSRWRPDLIPQIPLVRTPRFLAYITQRRNQQERNQYGSYDDTVSRRYGRQWRI
jgi:hypothetical protein